MKLLSASKIQRLGAMIARAAIPSIVIGTSICHGQELVPPRNADTAKASHEFKRIPVVAISDLQSNGISVAHLRVITDEISSQLQNTGFYRVMERSQMDRILVEQNFQQSGACDGSQCAVEIGRLLGIDRMLLGSVGLLGTTYTLHLRLVDVATGEILRNASAHLEGRIDDVLTQLVPKAVAVIASSSNGSRAVSVTPVATSPVAAIAPATSAWKPAPSTGPRVVARFESVPSGARVVDNGVELCTTPCQKAVPIGNHALLWELDGWMSYHDTVVVRESNQKFTRILTEVGSTVVVEAKDAGTQEDIAAEVWLAGGKIGNTPWQGTVTSQGNAISVRLVGYRDFDTALQVVKGKSITLQVALKRRDTRTIDLPDHGEVRVGSLVYKAPFIRQEVADSAFNREGATWITPWGTRWLRKEEERLTTWPVGLQLETELGFESNKWRGGSSATFDLAVGFPLGKKLSIVVLGHSAAYSTEFRNEVGGGVAYTNEFMKILFT
ncbi:MAG: hypothetical protein RL318_2250, partial [Fibrobacterota bacterium]